MTDSCVNLPSPPKSRGPGDFAQEGEEEPNGNGGLTGAGPPPDAPEGGGDEDVRACWQTIGNDGTQSQRLWHRRDFAQAL